METLNVITIEWVRCVFNKELNSLEATAIVDS